MFDGHFFFAFFVDFDFVLGRLGSERQLCVAPQSWNSFSVWCLFGSLWLDILSDSGKQQLDDHAEVLEDIILWINFLSLDVLVGRRLLEHAT